MLRTIRTLAGAGSVFLMVVASIALQIPEAAAQGSQSSQSMDKFLTILRGAAEALGNLPQQGGQANNPQPQAFPQSSGGYPPQSGNSPQPGGYPQPTSPGDGYPVPQAGAYPQPSGAYPAQSSGYPPPSSGYPPPQAGGYPAPQTSGYPQPSGAYPTTQSSGYPQPTSGYPAPQAGGYPQPTTSSPAPQGAGGLQDAAAGFEAFKQILEQFKRGRATPQ